MQGRSTLLPFLLFLAALQGCRAAFAAGLLLI
jgi:hypothetical protein